MVKIIIGTTPTIKYTFNVINPADFAEAIMTIKDSRKIEKLRKTLDEATVGTDYIEWTLTQEETLALGTGSALSMMLNWLTHGGTRGASAEETVIAVNNHIREVMSDE